MRESVTAEWLEAFDSDMTAGKNLAESIFWQLALVCLPEGIDENDDRVQAALAEIRRQADAQPADALKEGT